MFNNSTIKWRIAKVLPTVYDESLSYYEVLNKLIYKLNEVIDLTAQMEDVIHAIEELVSDEVLDKKIEKLLVELLESDRFEQILMAVINQYKSEAPNLTDGTAQAIYDCVYSYLKHNSDLQYAHTVTDEYEDEVKCVKTVALGGGQYEHTWKAFYHNAESVGYLIQTMSGVKDTSIDDNDGSDESTLTVPYFYDRHDYKRSGKPINCSTFVSLVLNGITYENSPYGRGSNPSPRVGGGSAGYYYNPFNGVLTQDNWRQHYRAEFIYKDMLAKGKATWINSDFSNINVGDIVFRSSDGREADPLGDGIYHCGIVVAKTNSHYKDGVTLGDYEYPLIYVADCGNSCYPIQINPYYSAGYKQTSSSVNPSRDIHIWTHVAHPDYGCVSPKGSELLFEIDGDMPRNLTWGYDTSVLSELPAEDSENMKFQYGEMISVYLEIDKRKFNSADSFYIRVGDTNQHLLEKFPNLLESYYQANEMNPNNHKVCVIARTLINPFETQASPVDFEDMISFDPTLPLYKLRLYASANTMRGLKIKVYRGYYAGGEDLATKLALYNDGNNFLPSAKVWNLQYSNTYAKHGSCCKMKYVLCGAETEYERFPDTTGTDGIQIKPQSECEIRIGTNDETIETYYYGNKGYAVSTYDIAHDTTTDEKIMYEVGGV